MKSRILFVDDSSQVLDSLQRILRPKQDVWWLTCCDDPSEAWNLLQTVPFDMVVSDVQMPGLTGLQLLEKIKTTDLTKDIPVVMLTGLGDRDLKRRALELGATDLLSKPVEREDLIVRIESVLRLKDCQDQLIHQNAWLETRVKSRTADLLRSRLDVVLRLGKAAEYRDNETGNHVFRVGCISRVVAVAMGMDRAFVETIFVASPLHDIGKIGIPDAILLKQGSLSDAQWRVMKGHCRIGERILREATRSIEFIDPIYSDSPLPEATDHGNPLIDMAARIALTHHEKWDGSGYPQGLVGDQIPIESRITAIADVFDALTSHRPYKPPFSEEKALSIVAEGVGTHFDTDVHCAFLSSFSEVQRIRRELHDASPAIRHEDAYDVPNSVRG